MEAALVANLMWQLLRRKIHGDWGRRWLSILQCAAPCLSFSLVFLRISIYISNNKWAEQRWGMLGLHLHILTRFSVAGDKGSLPCNTGQHQQTSAYVWSRSHSHLDLIVCSLLCMLQPFVSHRRQLFEPRVTLLPYCVVLKAAGSWCLMGK